MRLFLHDQNPDRRYAVLAALSEAALRPEVLESADAVRGLAALSDGAAGLMPLILGLDDGTAGLIDALRRAGAETAVLVVTDRRQAERDAALLDAGASDVIAPPLSGRELAARLRAALRRRNGNPRAEVTVGDLVIPLDGRDPMLRAQPVPLSAKENAVLCLLAANRGRVQTRAAIFDLLYGLSEYQPFDKAIDIHICRIRNKMARIAPEARDYIETFPGRGYALRTTPAAGDGVA